MVPEGDRTNKRVCHSDLEASREPAASDPWGLQPDRPDCFITSIKRVSVCDMCLFVGSSIHMLNIG